MFNLLDMIRIKLGVIISFVVTLCFAQTEKEQEFKKNYEKRIQLARIDDVYIPVNTEDAMKELVRLTEEEARKKLLTVPEDTIASKLHFSLGRWIMIHWGLEEGSRLSHYYVQKGMGNKDDIVDLLLRSFYRHLKGVALEEDKLVAKYIVKQKTDLEERKKKSKVIKSIRPGENHKE